jgi:membrane protein YdbS with pleckstrin-like domain
MYCKNCGAKLDNSAKFCSACGTPVSSGTTGFGKISSDKPLLVLKPVFIPLVTVLSILPVQIFFTIWGAGFFGGFGMFAVQALKLPLPPWFTFVFFGCLFFFGIPIVTYLAAKNTYAKTEYRFYNDKLDYYEGFFTVEEKTINYKNITETNLMKGIFQKKYGLGTIFLSTPATGFQSSSRARSGIRVSNIENPDDVYSKVKDLVSRVS